MIDCAIGWAIWGITTAVALLEITTVFSLCFRECLVDSNDFRIVSIASRINLFFSFKLSGQLLYCNVLAEIDCIELFN